MPHNDAAGLEREMSVDEPFGFSVFHTALPAAIRSLDDMELRILLIALLQEWRSRLDGTRE